MRALSFVVLLAACARGPVATSSPTTAATPAPAITAPAPARPSDAEITERSHRVLAAFDTADASLLDEALHPTFLQLEGGEPVDKRALLDQLKQRKPGVPYIATRTWDKERVVAQGDTVMFVGRAHEVQGGNETHGGGYRYVGWYTLHWIAGDAGWQLKLWTWQPGGELAQRSSWSTIYKNGVGFNKQPNKLLVETVRGKRPGMALDVAMGQGRNALYLAARGWKVTGVDIADEGIRQAREEAARRKLALDAVHTNIDQFDFGTAKWDLVTMIYATDNVGWIEKIKPSLKKGGLFVVEYFARDGDKGSGFAPGQLAKLFADGFTIVRDDLVEDVPDWAMDRAKLVRFVAKKR